MKWLYLFWLPSRPFLVKIGISNNPLRRRRQVGGNGRRYCLILFAVPLLFAESAETRLHRMFAKNRRRLPGISGGTEFFLIKILPFVLFFITLFLIFEVILAMIIGFLVYTIFFEF